MTGVQPPEGFLSRPLIGIDQALADIVQQHEAGFALAVDKDGSAHVAGPAGVHPLRVAAYLREIASAIGDHSLDGPPPGEPVGEWPPTAWGNPDAPVEPTTGDPVSGQALDVPTGTAADEVARLRGAIETESVIAEGNRFTGVVARLRAALDGATR